MKGNPMKPIQARKRTGVRQFSVRETRCPKTRTTRSQRSVPGRYQQPQQLWTFGCVASTRSPGMGFPVDTSDHPRLFTGDLKRQCWEKAQTIPGRDPERWRRDPAGNVVCRKFTGCTGCLCHDYDHIVPYSKGGRTELSNCQILQSRVNNLKSNKDNDPELQKGYSCAYEFNESELDVIEIAMFGDVNRVGRRCRCKSLMEFSETWKETLKARKSTKERDLLPDCSASRPTL